MMLPVNSTEPSKPRCERSVATHTKADRDGDIRDQQARFRTSQAQHESVQPGWTYLVDRHDHAQHSHSKTARDPSYQHDGIARAKSLYRSAHSENYRSGTQCHPSTVGVGKRGGEKRSNYRKGSVRPW